MEFFKVTLFESGKRMAIRVSNIESFEESTIKIEKDGQEKEEPCVLINMKDDSWIKVRETFDEIY